MQQYLTIKEVAEMLKINRVTLYKWKKTKKLIPVKFEGIVRYKLSDIEKIMK